MTGYDVFDHLEVQELFLLGPIGSWHIKCATVAFTIEGRPSTHDLKPFKFGNWCEEVVEFFGDILADNVDIQSGTIWCEEGWIEFTNGSWERFCCPELPERWR